jgi:hypothetical protein
MSPIHAMASERYLHLQIQDLKQKEKSAQQKSAKSQLQKAFVDEAYNEAFDRLAISDVGDRENFEETEERVVLLHSAHEAN